MTVNIIHDKDRKDRWRLLQQEIATHNLDVVYWPAVHHHNPRTGISRAHKQIVQWARDSRLPEILIAEDDFRLTAPGAFQYYISQKPEVYDIYLGGTLFGKQDRENKVRRFAGTHFWMIHSRFYNTILSLNEGLNIDTAVQKKGLFYVCDPMVAIVHDSYSDRLKAFTDHRKYFEGRKLFH